MIKKTLILLFFISFGFLRGQVLFSDNFNSYSLQTYTTVYSAVNYTTASPGYTVINDGFKNNVGSLQAPNKPFNVAALKTTGWAVAYNSLVNDTFLVSTSWLDTSVAALRYIVTPPVNAITGVSVLSWEAMAPDINYPDGYEIYATNNTTGTLSAASFNISDRIFSLADGNTAGGGEKNKFIKRGVSLATYAGQNLRFAFKNNSTNMYQLWIDDIKVENIPFGIDAEISVGQDIYKYNTVNTNGSIRFRITNRGYSNITSLNVKYLVVGTANNIVEPFSIVTPLTPYALSDFTFNAPYSMTTPGYYKVKVWVSDVNGAGIDQNQLNDTLVSFISIMATAPAKNVLVEQFVSSFDGYTPDGQDVLNALTSPSVIAVNIHDVDSLKNKSVNALINSYKQKYSTALIDRNYFYDINSVPVDRNIYGARINLRKPAIVPASVTITNKNYNSFTREITFTVNATFAAEVVGDYRINAYITENNVYGPLVDTSYNGWNQLSFMYSVPSSNYYQKGYFYAPANGHVLSAKYYFVAAGQDSQHVYMHQHVLTAAPDGAYGFVGIIPLTGGTLAQTYSRAYTYTLPVSPYGEFRYNADNIYIVGMVSECSTNKNYRTVLNCLQDKLTANAEAVFVKDFAGVANLFSLYPNPSYGALNILIPEKSFTGRPKIKVLDILGKEVYSQQADLSFGLLQLNLNHLDNGSYFISLDDGTSKSVKKLLIAR